jgi:hypothetical protein
MAEREEEKLEIAKSLLDILDIETYIECLLEKKVRFFYIFYFYGSYKYIRKG